MPLRNADSVRKCSANWRFRYPVELVDFPQIRYDAALVASIHDGVPSGEGADGFDGGARELQMPSEVRPQPVGPRDELAWGRPYEVDVGAILPSLVTDERCRGGCRAKRVEIGTMDDRSRRIEQRFEWPMVIAALNRGWGP